MIRFFYAVLSFSTLMNMWQTSDSKNIRFTSGVTNQKFSKVNLHKLLLHVKETPIAALFALCVLFQIIYWDSKAVYMEHRFITPKDDFVRAIAICQQRVITCNAEDIMKELLGPEAGIQKPDIPLEVAKWIECNEISSANLRNGC